MPESKASANFHTASGKTVFDMRKDARFLEYRRRWNENPSRFIVEGFPVHLDIEASARCNLRCPFCATTSENWGPRQKGLMEMDLYRKIIDEGVKNGLCSVKLSMRGEPLLHPELSEMVNYAKKNGIIDIYINTNATLLNADKVRRLIEAGLDRISISFEGTTKEVYEKFRVGAEYENVVKNVKMLRTIRDQMGVSHPQIRVQMLLLPELRDSFPEYVKFWDKIADEVGYLDAREESPEDDHRGAISEWACPFLWLRMAVLWDGTILPCSMWGIPDFELMSLGNANESGIKEKWSCENVANYRKLHKEGQAHRISSCDRCSYRAKELEKLGIKKMPKRGSNGSAG